MNTIQFVVQEDGTTIVPNYACGLKDKSVWVHYHGTTWAIWKLTDMCEKHVEKCKICEESLFGQRLNHLGKSTEELKAVFKAMGEAAQKTSKKIDELDELANLILDAMAEFLVQMVIGAKKVTTTVEEVAV